ncbi:MAG: ribosomal protein [Bacteroidota bacterium]|jgi:large subunit ribosomal protein L4
MEIEVYNIEGQKTGKKAKLDDSVFAIEPNDHAIYLDVKKHLAAQRTGTAKTKERNEVSGSTRKIKKQKGTGGARAGSIKSPTIVGGGATFGPIPRSYDIKVNKNTSRLARKSALTYKAKENGIIVVDTIAMDAPKTREFARVMSNLKLNGKKALVLLAERNDAVYRSARNIPNCNVQIASQVNTYEIMNSHNVVFVGNAHEVVTEILNK